MQTLERTENRQLAYSHPRMTPWGMADHVQPVGEGIALYSTPSHGGYRVAPDLYRQMPPQLKACSFTNDNWFEEDCSWCAVALAFPHLFEADHVAAARKVYDGHYAKEHGALGI